MPLPRASLEPLILMNFTIFHRFQYLSNDYPVKFHLLFEQENLIWPKVNLLVPWTENHLSSFKYGFLNIFRAKPCCVVCQAYCLCYGGTKAARNNEHPHWECISSPGMGMCLTENAHPHREWGCASLEMYVLTWNGDVPHWEWGCVSPGMHIITAPGMGICLTENAYPYREWGCASPRMHILTGKDVPHQECTSSSGMHILTANAHSLYRVRPMESG